MSPFFKGGFNGGSLFKDKLLIFFGFSEKTQPPKGTFEGKKQVVIRVKTQEPAGIVKDLEKAGYTVESVQKGPSI